MLTKTYQKGRALKPNRKANVHWQLVTILSCIGLVGSPVVAGDSNSKQGELGTLTIVDGAEQLRTSNSIDKVAPTGKVNVPIENTPFSISVVDEAFFKDVGAKNIQDALSYSAGVYAGQFGFDTRGDFTSVRGLDAANYLDGLRSIYGFYNSVRTDLYTLESIEVLKGPASVLYGQSDLGGIVNAVSKLPQEKTSREIWFQAGSFDRGQIAADLTGPLTDDGKWLYRLVALNRESGTQVDQVDNDGFVFMPSLTWRPSDMTSLTLLMNWQENEGQVSAQFLPSRGTIDSAPRGRIATNRFVGEPDWDRYDRKKREISLMLDHQINTIWSIAAIVRKTDSETETREHWVTVGAVPTDNGDAFRTIHTADRETDILNLDVRLNGDFDTGIIKHNFVIGLDRQDAKWEEGNYFTGRGLGGTINLYDPVYGNLNTSVITPVDRNDNKIEQLGIYLIDNMEIGRFIVSTALRYDDADNTLLVVGGDDVKSTDEEVTGRIGLMYKFDNGISPYISYSEAFAPNLGTDNAGGTLDPTTGEQREAGVKYLSADKSLSLTLAYFDIEQKQRVIQGSQPGGVEQTGAEVDGWELELKKRWLNAEVLASFTHMDAKQNDERLPYVAERLASVWGRYDVSDQLRVGAGVRYIGDNVGFGGDPLVPSVTLYDALVGYSVGDWDFSLNAQNLFDEVYVSWCRFAGGDCGYGERRNILASARYNF